MARTTMYSNYVLIKLLACLSILFFAVTPTHAGGKGISKNLACSSSEVANRDNICKAYDAVASSFDYKIHSLNEFSIELLQHHLFLSNYLKNSALSGVGIQKALSIAYLGSGDKNHTRANLGQMLGFRYLISYEELLKFYSELQKQLFLDFHADTNNPVINLINKIYVPRLNLVKASFQARTSQLGANIQPFSVQDNPTSVNDEIKLISLFMINSKWKNQFNPKYTKQEVFYHKQQSIPVYIMETQNVFNYYENKTFQIIELPYLNSGNKKSNNSKFSMYIVLPKLTDFRLFVGALNNNTITKMINKMKEHYVNLKLPRFDIDTDLDLESNLKKAEFATLFQKSQLDFSEISELPLYFSKIQHKAIIKVREQGTAAVSMGDGLYSSESISNISYSEFVMNVNHPFLILIRDNESGLILFHGAVVSPSAL